MTKYAYVRPAVKVKDVECESILLSTSVTTTDGNANINYGGAGNEDKEVRSRGMSVWDEE